MTDTIPSFLTPLTLYHATVQEDWIDYNGHMNVASYTKAFDLATDDLTAWLGMTPNYRKDSRCSCFNVETHNYYRRELVIGDPLVVSTQLLGYDNKRIHCFHRMLRQDNQLLAASAEMMLVHVNLEKRQAANMPKGVLERLESLMKEHRQLSKPLQSGRVMGIYSKPVD